MTFENTLEFAKKLDSQDQLHKYQDQFIFPQVNGKKVIQLHTRSRTMPSFYTQTTHSNYIQKQL